MTWLRWAAPTGLAALGLGCGLLGEDPPEPEPEPLPIVVPPSIVGTWYQATLVDSRGVVEWPCQGEPLRLDLPQGGPLTLTGSDGQQVAALTMAELKSDASVQLSTAQGELNLADRDQGLAWAKGSLFGLSEGVLLASAESDAIEHLHAPATTCGVSLDTGSLVAGSYNATGDPCVAPGLTVKPTGRVPLVVRSGKELQIAAVRQTERGTWITVRGDGDDLHGIRLVPRDDGSLEVWQRLDAGMASELLAPISGTCKGTPALPTAEERQRKPPRQGPDRRLPR